MNHFAHLVLSQATVESAVGNLLGDFARGVEQSRLATPVKAGLQNHRAVDKFTDNHPLIRQLKQRFSAPRRRFAGIALDIYFDHLLINFWDHFECGTPEQAITTYYRRLQLGHPLMPSREMQKVTSNIVEYDWFNAYRDIDSIALALDRVAARIRFANNFGNTIEDLRRNHEHILAVFFTFYPQLKKRINELAIEHPAE